ncbi:kinase-like protein [Gigaspora margarita]|uniref:Kinase-like protein n=1 Tax=Gigaspora margarita TaxID=4874 RepID=A0A8H3XIT6_GIGMA|nr:kinase-like protein [Gigaspora margarita]
MDKIDSEIISEIENGNLKKFNQEDVQDIQCLSNISDELNEIKRANNLNNNRHVVLKFLKENDEDKYYDIFNREIKNLIKIYPNENVIKCFGVTKDPSKNFYSIVLEYCGDKNLSEDLEVVSKKGWPYKIKMAKGIANGLNYIHMENIILCNLNSKNIISHNDKLVIADFSSSISLDSQMKSTIKITDKNVAYVDPKCFNRIDMFNKSSDIYSLGVILWEISSGRPPFSNNQLNIDDFKKSLVLGKRESPINLTPVDYKELYCDAWNKDQHNRLSASEVINCLEEIEPDLLYQNSVYIPEISYKMNNSISQKKACLKIIEGSSQSNGIFLREGEMLIGRKSSNDIVIKDHEVDKEHASIKNYQGKVEIIGLGSKSKIFVIGEQLEFRTLYPLKRNDIIKMGQSTFQYIPAGEYENYIDPLLMIYNTAYLRKSLENEFKNSKNLSLSLLFFDLDQFEITNEYSNEAADYVLMELSKLIQNKYVRDKDTFARYGDANEFAILLIDTNVESAYEIANEIRCFVETYPFNFKEKKLQSITLNLNIGISEMNSSVKSSKDLLNHAKEACRRAKEYGSNQIVIWENDQISIQKVRMPYSVIF